MKIKRKLLLCFHIGKLKEVSKGIVWFSYQNSLQTYNNEKEKLQSLKYQCSQYGKV